MQNDYMAYREFLHYDDEFPYKDLDTLVEEDLVPLIDTLNETLEGTNPHSAFIHQSLELMYPDIFVYTDSVTRILCPEGLTEAARLGGYRAFHFAHSIGSLVLPGPTNLSTDTFYDNVHSPDDIKRKLETSTNAYLAHRKALDCITGYFIPELEPTGCYPHIAEIVAGSTFMFIDNAERKRVIEECVAEFAVSLKALDENEDT